ncbi:integrase core domain-containing protein [Corynebacterium diphtheriae]|uniref:integrase core domain-containing protein n=2 Tax=Corynebacterium diphtheriae TaxID=1717 RepID=UPI0015F62275
MTMLWLKTLTAPHKNELIHTRRWDDVVEVEIATLEWMSWWNQTRLNQSLGYRTPVEVETEFWKQNPQQGIIKIKANA